MNILYSSDDRYAPVMGVSITSLFENNKEIDTINVYIFENGISTKNKSRINKLARQYGRNIKLIDASEVEAYLQSVGAMKWGGSRVTWYRCFAGRLLPDDVDRVLYIDCDTIVVDSLEGLEKIDFEEGKALAMTTYPVSDEHRKHTNLPEGAPLYSGGLIYFSMNRWRELGCEDKLVSIIKSKGDYFGDVDQGAINCAVHEHIRKLPLKYNVLTGWIDSSEDNCDRIADDFKEELQKAMDEIVIAHFLTNNGARPWEDEGCGIPYARQWREYKSISPWKDDKSLQLHRYGYGYKARIRWILNRLGIEDGIFKLYSRLFRKADSNKDMQI